MRRILLDTNGYVKLLLGEQEVLEEIGEADQIFIPTVVLGELYAGFKGGSKEKYNRKLLEKFLNKSGVVIATVNKETAEVFDK